ncbi:MAG TPA: hypothetical protein PKM50_09640 [Methanoregula sp.]|nr:hypothetical protein [Methanoregula sp.]
MTDNEWILLCLTAAVCAIVVILLHTYPWGAAIDGTRALIAGGSP